MLISCFKRLSFIIIFKKESKKKRRSQKQREREVEASSSSHLDTPAEKRKKPPDSSSQLDRTIYIFRNFTFAFAPISYFKCCAVIWRSRAMPNDI